MEKTAEFIIMEWFTEYRKANNLTNIQYVDVNDLLLFLARNHASQFKHPVPDEAGLYSRKQLEDAHIVGYRKGRLADKDSDSVYQDAKNYAATIHPSQPEGDGWVSVEDRLPAIPPPYYEDGCKITPTGVQILVYDSLENYVYEDSYSGEFSNSYITHWQPLPSPPNK